MEEREVVLEGWFDGAKSGLVEPVYETGSSLNEIVIRLQKYDDDFGHTDMEFNLHLPSGKIKSVEETNALIERIVSNS